MNGYRPLVLLLAFAAAVGCHYRDPSIDLLESELRLMEDQVYLLEDELHHRCQQLDECRHQCVCATPTPATVQPAQPTQPQMLPQGSTPRAIDPLRQYEILPNDPVPERPYFDTPVQTNDLPSDRPSLEMPTQEQPVPERPRLEPQPMNDEATDGDAGYEIVPPDVELPQDVPTGIDDGLSPIPAMPLSPGARPVIEGAEPPQTNGKSQPALDFSFRDVGSTEMVTQAANDESAIDANVTHIVARAELSGGRGFDHQATDVDLLVLVEPRNKNGQYVELAGPVSVVVLDGDKVGSAARIARWDYDAGSARRATRRSSLGQGIHLELNWPDEEPDSENLHVFVRFTTIEDRRLETDLRLEADPERITNGRWRVVDRSRNDSPAAKSATWPTARIAPIRTASSGGFELTPIEPPESIALPVADIQPVEMPDADASHEWNAIEPLEKPEWSPYR